MKRSIVLTLATILTLSTGCASFTTTQTDRFYDSDTGKLAGEKTTVASSFTFFDSKSSLATWTAKQTDKTQQANVGGLAQEAYATNAVQAIRLIIEGARPVTGGLLIP